MGPNIHIQPNLRDQGQIDKSLLEIMDPSKWAQINRATLNQVQHRKSLWHKNNNILVYKLIMVAQDQINYIQVKNSSWGISNS